MKILSTNKKALFEYDVLKKFQAGMVLAGWEVKSIKQGNVSLKESYIRIFNNEAFIEGMHVSQWKGMAEFKEDSATRQRKLLLNSREINSLQAAVKIKGHTIIPIQLFSDKNKIKLEIALAKGRKRYDKRARLKEKDEKRQIDRDLKSMGYN